MVLRRFDSGTLLDEVLELLDPLLFSGGTVKTGVAFPDGSSVVGCAGVASAFALALGLLLGFGFGLGFAGGGGGDACGTVAS